MSRRRPHTDASRRWMAHDMLIAAKHQGSSFRTLSTASDAEKVRSQLNYLMKNDTTFDWSGYIVGRKRNMKTHQMVVFVTNDEKKVPAGIDAYHYQKLELQIGYAVNILCTKKYMGVCALPKMRSYKEVQQYLTEKCEERLGYPVEIIIHQDENTKGYHAHIKKKEG